MPTSQPSVIAFEAHSAGAVVSICDLELVDRVVDLLPWGAKQRGPTREDRHFELIRQGGDGYGVVEDGELRYSTDNSEHALLVLASYLFLNMLLRARDVLFVHAGVVAHNGCAIVLPGGSGSGKTTLIGALIKAGAQYYTDDYSPLDPTGRVHPYRIPLWFRDPETGHGVWRPAESLGAETSEEQVPVGLVAHLPYRDGAELRLEPRTEAAGMMLLLANALGSDLRPDFALTVARQAAAGAQIFEGERGDADEAAAALLELAGAAV